MSATPFTCYIIGGSTLPIQCGEIILQAGHCICGVVSTDEGVRKWAALKSIECTEPGIGLRAILERVPFDYLFSIVNEHLLDEAILALPRKAAINYHDAPLPRYAGTHATSWALMNKEESHGVSWHIASKQVDAGDILVQRHFDIGTTETAFTLNTKCYEAAIDGFRCLVEDLASGRSRPVRQDLRVRTFFPRYKRPLAGGLISWTRSAEDIVTLVRALDFGPHPNPMGCAKFAVGECDFVLAREAEDLTTAAVKPAGTVLSLAEKEIVVATGTTNIALRRLSSIDGRITEIKELVERFQLRVGQLLPTLAEGECQSFEQLYTTATKQEAFWVEKLSALQPLALPYADLTASNSHPGKPRILQVPWPENVLPLLQKYSDDCTTLGEVVIAAWAAYLSRLVCSGSFDLGFTYPSLISHWGLFAEQVPARFQASGEQVFESAVQGYLADLRELKRRSTFLADVFLRYPVLRGLAKHAAVLPVAVRLGKQTDRRPRGPAAALTLVVSSEGSEYSWEYVPDLIQTSAVESMARQFLAFLQGVVAEPTASLAHLPLMSSAELHRVLCQWNETRAPYPKDLCVHQLFEAQVERTPEAVALVWERQQINYRELNGRANRLAHRLRALGVGTEILVGVCLERTPDLVVSLLAVHKAGGAYVPMDPRYPQDRLAYIAADAKVPVLITHSKFRSLFPRPSETDCSQPHLECLDLEQEVINATSALNPENQTKPKNLSHAIYTSGSTGKPKGVGIEHRNVNAFLHWAKDVFTPDEFKGVLAATSVCFDLSVFEIFAPLSWGGTVILAENALELPLLPHAKDVTLVNTVPSAVAELLRIDGIPSSVCVVNLAGEPLPRETVDLLYAKPHIRKVYDLYGPTEDTVYSTFTLRQPKAPATIGKPLANKQVYLLDSHQQPVPVGLPGEIFIGGDCVARGYLNQPQLTAQKFVPDPFSKRPNARLYRTGDLARYRDDGNLEFLGRIDHQVKIRGFRIELGEIESVLREHPGVNECVVLAREDEPGLKRLVAYIAGKFSSEISVKDWHGFLKQKLPDFMVPAAFVFLPNLPLTPNGKVDRRALPKPDLTRADTSENFVACRDEVEEKLVHIWEEVLAVRPIGIKDNYFELGGDSLRAVRMFAMVEDIFKKKLGLATLFKAPTVESLAEVLRTEQPIKWSLLVPIQPNGTKIPFFCIHARGGNVLFYRDLAKRLGEDQPFYGIQAQGLDGREPYLSRVEEMAARYIKEMKSIQPHGPYLVGGSSFGGTAAFEIAHQLRAAGDEVGLLAVFDTGGPGYPKYIPVSPLTLCKQRVQTFARRAQQHLWALQMLEPTQRWPYFVNKAHKLKVNIKRRNRRLLISVASKFPSSLGRWLLPSYVNARWALFEFENSIRMALQNYTHRLYPGRLTLFRASKQPIGIYPDPSLGWGACVSGELEIYEVPGNHGSIVVEPGVRFLAEKLRHCIVAATVHPRSRAEAKPSPVCLQTEPAAVG